MASAPARVVLRALAAFPRAPATHAVAARGPARALGAPHGGRAPLSILSHLRRGPGRREAAAASEKRKSEAQAIEAGDGALVSADDGARGAVEDLASREEAPARLPMEEVVRDLAEGRRVREEVLEAVGQTKEFRAYAAEADVVSTAIRVGYADSKTPMTPARRTQMQAHAKAAVEETMRLHAEDAAEAAVAAMSDEQRARLQALFASIEEGAKGKKAWALPGKRETPFDAIEGEVRTADADGAAAGTDGGAPGSSLPPSPPSSPTMDEVASAVKYLTDVLTGREKIFEPAPADGVEDEGGAADVEDKSRKRD